MSLKKMNEPKNTAKAPGKQILIDAVTRAENAAKNAFNEMVDQATGALKMDKNFIHIREFYNFMRIGNGQNAPTPFFYFSPNFYNGANEIDLETGVTNEHTFFKKHIGEFARFRYCIQAISFPSLSLRSYDSGTGGGSNAYKDITNLFGGYTTLQNSFINADAHTLDMNILNTHKPVVENFIYPWMLDALRSFYGGSEGGTPIPRVNMAVKFWSPNHITHQMEGVKPDFVYYVTGLFPVKIKGYNPIQMPSDSAIQRSVTFAFNDFIIINSESDALKYNLGEFFIGNFIHGFADKATSGLRDFVNDGLGKLANKLRDKIDKKKKPESPRTPPKGNSPSGSNGDDKNKIPENPNVDDSDSNNNNSENKNQAPENPTNQQNDQNNSQMNSQQASQNSQTPQSTNRNQLTSSNVQNLSLSSSSTRSSSNVGNLTLNSAQSLGSIPSKDNSSNFSNLSLDDNIQMMNILNADDSLGEIIETENEFEAATENANSIDRESYSTEEQMNSNEAVDRASSNEHVQSRSPSMMNRNQLNTYSPEPQESSTSLLSRDEAIELNSSNVKKYAEPIVTVDRLDHSASLRAPISNYKNVSRSSNVVKTSQSPVSSYSSINRNANSVDLSSTPAMKANPQSQAALDSVKDRYSQNLSSIKTSNLSKNDLQSKDALKSYDKTTQSSDNNELDSIVKTNDIKTKTATMSMTDAVSKVMNSRDDEEIINADDELSIANNKKEEHDERTRSQINDSLKVDVNDTMIEPINSESLSQMSLDRASNEYSQETNVKKEDRSAVSTSELGMYASNEPLVIKDGKLVAYVRPDTDVSESVKSMYEVEKSSINIEEALNRTNLPSSTKNDNSLNTLEEIDKLERSFGYPKAEYVESQEFNVKDIAKSYDNVNSIINLDLAMHSTPPGSNYINKIDDANAKMQAGQYVERQEDIERSTNAHKSNISVYEAIDNGQYLNSDDEIIIDFDDELNTAKNKTSERLKSSNQIDSSMRVDISEKESTPINNGVDSQLDRSQASEMNGQDIQKMQVIESESSITDRSSFSDEERSINSEKSNMSLAENVEMVKTRSSDEDFEEIINAEDEKQTHTEMNTNDVLASLKKSITLESSLNTDDYENISSILIKDQSITSEKYNIFELYASAARKDVKDVLKEYKGLTKDDLGKFVSDVQNTLIKKKEEAAAKLENPIEVSNGKLVITPLKDRSEIEAEEIKKKKEEAAAKLENPIEVSNGKLVITPLKDRSEIEAEEIKKKNSNERNTVEISHGKIVPQITPEKTSEEIEKLKQKSNKEIELKKIQDTNVNVNAHPQIIPVKKISQDDINDLF